MRVGDLATFKSSRSDYKGQNGEYDHIGMISKVNKDDNGYIISFNVIHATSSNGVMEQTYDMKNGMSKFELRDVYQWDTPDETEKNSDIPCKYDFTPPPPAYFIVGKEPTFIDNLMNSRRLIVKTFGEILNAIIN